jgi:hypothetical protein
MIRAEQPSSPAVPLSGDEVKELIAKTYDRNDFDSLTEAYHFKATYQTFSSDGNISGSGFIERWASADGPMKTVTRFGDHTMTEYAAHHVKVYQPPEPLRYTDDGFEGNIMLYFVHGALFYPTLPRMGIINRQITPTVEAVSGDLLDCGSVVLQIGPRQYPPLPNDRFCVSRSAGDLVLRHTDNLSIHYSDFSPFLDKSIARSITGTQGSKVRFQVKIGQLDQATLPAQQFVAPADASPISPHPEMWATTPQETAPAHVDKLPANSALKATHAAGQVVLYVLVSRSGKVTDVEPLFASSPELADYAIQIAHGYSYKPIVKYGQPLQEIAHAYFTFKF